MAFDTTADLSGAFRQGFYQPQLEDIAFKQKKQEYEQSQAMAAALKEEYSKEEPTPTQGGFTPEGQVTSPTISFLEKQVKAAGKAGNLAQYKESIKLLEDVRNKESEIQKRNLEIEKDKNEHIASAAQHIIDTGDLEGGVAIYAKYDPAGAMQAYAKLSKLPKDKQKLAAQQLLAQFLPAKEMADIKAKQLATEETKRHHDEIEKMERTRIHDKEQETIDKREERKQRQKDTSRQDRIQLTSQMSQIQSQIREINTELANIIAPPTPEQKKSLEEERTSLKRTLNTLSDELDKLRVPSKASSKNTPSAADF